MKINLDPKKSENKRIGMVKKQSIEIEHPKK